MSVLKPTASLQELAEIGMPSRVNITLISPAHNTSKQRSIQELVMLGFDSDWLLSHGYGEPAKYEPKQDAKVKWAGEEYDAWYVHYDDNKANPHVVCMPALKEVHWILDENIRPIQEPK